MQVFHSLHSVMIVTVKYESLSHSTSLTNDFNLSHHTINLLITSRHKSLIHYIKTQVSDLLHHTSFLLVIISHKSLAYYIKTQNL